MIVKNLYFPKSPGAFEVGFLQSLLNKGLIGYRVSKTAQYDFVRNQDFCSFLAINSHS